VTRLGFPLPLRNALAELAIAALDDEAAAAALAWLAAPAGAPRAAAEGRLAAVHLIDPGAAALLPIHAPHAAEVQAHATRALRAAHAFRPDAHAGTGRACRAAAALWNEGLFFEVHEVLEAVWKTAAGPERQALQGLIQIAVAFHHLAHGNRRGAASLMTEGYARLASVSAATLPGIDVARLLRATAPWEAALARGETPADEPPRLELARQP
jgi:hypothetical protein